MYPNGNLAAHVLGYTGQMEHKENGSHCTLKRMETFQKEPKLEDAETDDSTISSSGQSSVVSLKRGKDMPPTDDSDGGFRRDSRRAVDGRLKDLSASSTGGAK